MTQGTKEIIAIVVAGFGVVGFTEWRVRAAEDEAHDAPAAIAKQLKSEIDKNDAQARERSEWFKEAHREKAAQMQRIEQKLDALILRQTGSVSP